MCSANIRLISLVFAAAAMLWTKYVSSAARDIDYLLCIRSYLVIVCCFFIYSSMYLLIPVYYYQWHTPAYLVRLLLVITSTFVFDVGRLGYVYVASK